MSSTAKRSRQNKTSSHDQSSSPSASSIGSNVDLLSLILLCLPVKSIFAFKLVSKVWLSAILSSRFQESLGEKCRLLYSGTFIRKLFCLRNTDQEFEYNLLQRYADSSVPVKPLVFGKNKKVVKIDQSCNGLLLCSYKMPTNRWNRAYYVYNSCTEEHKFIPRRGGFDILASVSLAFDPSKSPFYKVISLWGRQRGHRIDIYSSQTSTWKNCGEKFQVDARLLSGHGVYWNGCLNWMGNQGTLVYFEVDHEVIKHLPEIPYVIDGEMKMVCYFDVCRGHLQMIVQDTTESHFDVLEMDIAYTGWSLKYHIDLVSGLRASHPTLVGENLKFSVMLYDEVDADGKGSPKLFLLIPGPVGHGVVLLDIMDMQFRRIHHLEQPCLFPNTCGMLSDRLYQHTASVARA